MAVRGRPEGSLMFPAEGPIPEPTLREADEAASVAHDFIYGKNGVTKEQASVAIWMIHNALRPRIERGEDA